MNDTAPSARSSSPALRASDADRDRVAEILATALGEGRLTQEEHGERLDAVYAAKTHADLAPLTEDLPQTPGSAAFAARRPPAAEDADLVASATGSENLVALLGTAERKGRWLVEKRTNTSVLLGNVELDMRQAVMAQREVTVQAAVVLGNVSVIVPPGVRVVNKASAVLGAVTLGEPGDVPPDAPTVVIRGLCLLGSVTVEAKGLDD
jgi:hypothetical protein